MTDSYIEAFKLVAIAAGGGFALWKYFEELRWRRQKFASELWASFSEREHNKKAMVMLDWVRSVELPIPSAKEPSTQRVTTGDLISSLQVHAHNTTFTPKHAAVRDIFDAFLTDLTEIEHHIDRGLITFDQVKAYLLYWLKAMTGTGHVQHKGLPKQLSQFIEAYEYRGIKSLCARAGLHFPD